VIVGALYLAGVWLNGIGSSLPERILPRPVLYFVQVAKLFTKARTVLGEYRAEAWLCDERRWVEIDTRAHFSIDREHKENHFQRALHFYRRHRETLQALDRYLMESHARGHRDDGLPPGARIGGSRFLSIREPLPAPGKPAARWRRAPLAEIPKEGHRRWYWTPRSKRAARCGGAMPTAEEDE
jgi:hypothetical protein